MAQHNQFTPVIANWPRILFYASIGLVLAVLLSLVRPLEYSATTRIGITQELGSADAYTASRSAERIADNLSDAVYFTAVFNELLDAFPDIDESYFGSTEKKRREKWGNAINTSVTRGNGLLTIRVYHTNPEQARMIAGAVADYLAREGWRYTSGTGISIQVVDDVLLSTWPVRPNIPMNGFSGFLLGGLAGVGYILIQSERLRRRHQMIFEE